MSLQATFWPGIDHNTLFFSPLIFLLTGKEMKGVRDDVRGPQGRAIAKLLALTF